MGRMTQLMIPPNEWLPRSLGRGFRVFTMNQIVAVQTEVLAVVTPLATVTWQLFKGKLKAAW